MSVEDPFIDVIGQKLATDLLRTAIPNPVHAYLFVGPRGAGKRRAAVRMAGELVGSQDDRHRNRELAKREEHPDVKIFEPGGNAFLMEEAEAVVVEASRSPSEAGRKVLILDRFHDATADVAAKLLKTIEEPPASTMFILLAEHVPPGHITVASRSVNVSFPSVTEASISEALIARGIDAEQAHVTARGACGDVNRAELLLTDEAFVARRDLWWSVPGRLDGTGHAVTEIASEIKSVVDEAQAPLDARHEREVAIMNEKEELTGSRGSGRKSMEARHKREVNLHRSDEWRMGLATMAHRYREELVAGSPETNVFDTLSSASSALARNPSPDLWLANTLLSLPTISVGRS